MAEPAASGCWSVAPLEWVAAAIARLPQRLLLALGSGLALLLWPVLAHVGRQDAAILAAQQDNMDRFGGRPPMRSHGDVLRPLLEDWWYHGRAPSPSRARQLTLWL